MILLTINTKKNGIKSNTIGGSVAPERPEIVLEHHKTCPFAKDVTKKPDYWLSKSGNKFPYSEYSNYGRGGGKSLPEDEQPYELISKIEYVLYCCKHAK